MTMPIVPPFAVKASFMKQQYDVAYNIDAPYGASSAEGPTVSPLSALVTPPTSAVDAQNAAEDRALGLGFLGYDAQSQVEKVTLNGAPNGGTFVLSFAGETTTALTYNSTATEVQTALLALKNVPAAAAIPTIQTVTLTNNPTGGTFTLTFGGQTTAAIPFDADAAKVQSALRKLSTVPANSLLVTSPVDLSLYPPPAGGVFTQYGGPYTVTFSGSLQYTALPITASGANLIVGTPVTGDTDEAGLPVPGVDVVVTQQGTSTPQDSLVVTIASGGNAGGGSVAGGPYTVTYGGALSDLWEEPMWEPFIVGNGGALTVPGGSAPPSVSVVIVRQGHPAYESKPIQHKDEQYDFLRNEWDTGCGNNFTSASTDV